MAQSVWLPAFAKFVGAPEPPTVSEEEALRNVGPDDWVMTPEGEPAITVPSKRRLGVRTMIIDFGSVEGQIRIE